MTKQTQGKKVRKQHTQAFKEEALRLSEKVGVAQTARELGLHDSQLYDWRQKANRRQSQSEVEQTQATEIARLKRQMAEQAEELAILKKAATYFAKNLK
jgi:transposase